MRKAKSGHIERRGEDVFLRIRLKGQRPRIRLGSGLNDAEAEALANRVLERLATGAYRVGRAPPAGSQPGAINTVRELAKAWTSGALLAKHGKVNGLRPIASDKVYKWTIEKRISKAKTRGAHGPDFGDLLVAEVTDTDCELVMAPQKGSGQTCKHTYNRLKRLFDLAVFPCKLRPDNPVREHLKPSPDPEKQYCYLYPDELLVVLRRRTIPLGRRVLYAMAVYTGGRKSTLYRLRWFDIDFEHGTIRRGRAKKSPGNLFVADSGLMALLWAWYEYCGRPSEDARVVRDVGPDAFHDQSKLVRRDLKEAGITRSILFVDSDEVEPIRFHDMRATFVTWAKRAGKDDAWVTERTGQVDEKTIKRYTRAARTLEDLGYEPFPDISTAIPELAQTLPSDQPTGP